MTSDLAGSLHPNPWLCQNTQRWDRNCTGLPGNTKWPLHLWLFVSKKHQQMISVATYQNQQKVNHKKLEVKGKKNIFSRMQDDCQAMQVTMPKHDLVAWFYWWPTFIRPCEWWPHLTFDQISLAWFGQVFGKMQDDWPWPNSPQDCCVHFFLHGMLFKSFSRPAHTTGVMLSSLLSPTVNRHKRQFFRPEEVIFGRKCLSQS